MAKTTTRKTKTPQATERRINLSGAPAKPRKERLFEDFYRSACGTFEALEAQFGVRGVCDQVFGETRAEVVRDEEAEMRQLRANPAWSMLSALYDYAIDGLDHGGDPETIVIDGADVLWLVTSENHQPSDEWSDIVAMSDSRFALDEGSPVLHHRLALLANVDLRTVRNAISGGELASFKQDDEVFVENASARRWLLNRKGFKPTVMQGDLAAQQIDGINAPATFGAYLADRRKRLGLAFESGKPLILHRSVDVDALAQLEAGIFVLTLDAVFPLADFYQLGRKAFLNCVMRVFFNEELQMLRNEEQA